MAKSLHPSSLVSAAVVLMFAGRAFAQPAGATTQFTSMRSTRSLSMPTKTVPHSPEEISFHLNEEGVQLILKGERAGGQKRIEQALEYNPQNTTALYNLAGLYLTSGNAEKAVAAMQQAVTLAPDDLAFLNRLAESHFANSDLRGAIATYEKIVDADPTYEQSLVRLGSLYGMVQEWDKAEAALRRALLQSPKDRRVITNLASVLVVQKKLAEAISLIEGLEDHDSDPDLLTTLGVAHEGLGNKQQALLHFESAAQAGKRDEEFLGKIRLLRKEIEAEGSN